MALLDLAYMGHPILRKDARPIETPITDETRRLAADMLDTMAANEGVGLAAPQVHQGLRLIVFLLPGARLEPGEEAAEEVPTALVNPVFEPMSAELAHGLEGCLSIPGLRGIVPRFRHIRYRGLALDGTPVEREATGFHARVVQHEIDHLDGVLFLDRMTDLRSLAFESELHHLLDESA
ncbi:MAG: peptide deformylase [Alphaproteobacteria bacterium]|jgi:peptide deformylase|nr:peptide deformylase [Alphaproteobacteria bacterium]